mgnify:CR=1 FL=1
MKTVLNILKYGFVIFLAFLMSGPVLTAVLGSIRTSGEVYTNPFALPRNGIQWENYTFILGRVDFWRQVGNSLLITIGATIITVIISSLLAFIFARIDYRGKEIWFNILMLGLLFPLSVAILPVFIQLMRLNLLDSYWGVILPIATFSTPGNTVILRNFFTAIPTELEDAAYIDGCTPLGFFRYILFPMARPTIAAVATLEVVASWNEYF